MACMGPDYVGAKKQADAAFEDIMKLLKEKYFLSAPKTNKLCWGITKHVEEHDQIKSWMKECVEKMFEIDASDSF